MAFRSYVAPGSEIGVRLLAADTNRDPATMTTAIVDPPDGAGTAGLTVAPGTSRATTVFVGAMGTLRVHVHFARPDAKGELEIRVNGAVLDVALIIGDTMWDYVVGVGNPAAAGGAGAPTVFRGGMDSRQSPR